jgi:hypothetical protein
VLDQLMRSSDQSSTIPRDWPRRSTFAPLRAPTGDMVWLGTGGWAGTNVHGRGVTLLYRQRCAGPPMVAALAVEVDRAGSCLAC